MGIVDLLKSADEKARVSNLNDKWLVWDETTYEWVVYQRKLYAKTTTVAFRGTDEEAAVAELLK